LRIGPDASVREVIETMIARRNGCVVVVDGEDRPLGIISERDLIPMAMAEEVPGGKLLKAILEADAIVLGPGSLFTRFFS